MDKLANTEENIKRIKNVEDCFGNSGQPLQKIGRVFVGEGVLMKMCRKRPKERQFVLFNDILIYGNIVTLHKKYNKQHVLPLEEVKIVPLVDDGDLRNGWQIISRSKSFAVYALTPVEKDKWMAHINSCIADRTKKIGKTPFAHEAAVFVPDSTVVSCMVCQKTKFNAINRRHHCRKCGLVVCGKCSSKKHLVPHVSSQEVRVCDRCYEQLSSKDLHLSGLALIQAAFGGISMHIRDHAPVENSVNDGDVSSKRALTRTESDAIAESGSSADEQSDDDEDTNSPSSMPEKKAPGSDKDASSGVSKKSRESWWLEVNTSEDSAM